MALEPHELNYIIEEMDRRTPNPEIIFDVVTHRDVIKKLVWTDAFGQLSIPLIAFDYGIVYYVMADGVTTRYSDTNPEDVTNPAFLTHLQVPKIGEQVAILRPGGQFQFPVCIGKVHSVGHWEGEL